MAKKEEVVAKTTEVKADKPKPAAAKAQVVRAPFKITYKDSELVPEVLKLTKVRGDNEAHLAYVLHEIYSRETWKSYEGTAFENFGEFVKEVLRISPPYANAHIANYRFLVDLGLAPEDLAEYDYAKVKMVSKLMKVMTLGQIKHHWLPKAKTEGKDSRSVVEIESLIKEKLDSAREGAGDQTTKAFKIPTRAEDLPRLSGMVEELKAVLQVDSSQALQEVLAQWLVENKSKEDVDLSERSVLNKVKSWVETAVPDCHVIFLGASPMSYEVFIANTKEGPVAYIAPDRAMAEKMAKTKDIARITTHVADIEAVKAKRDNDVAAARASAAAAKTPGAKAKASAEASPWSAYMETALVDKDEHAGMSAAELHAKIKATGKALRTAGVLDKGAVDLIIGEFEGTHGLGAHEARAAALAVLTLMTPEKADDEGDEDDLLGED